MQERRDVGLIPGLGRSPGGGFGNPFQYSYLENPMDRGAWQFTVHGIAQSWTRLMQLSMQYRRTSRQSPYLRESDKLTPRGKLVQSLWKTLCRFLKQLKIELTYEPVIPFLGIRLEEILIWKDTCPPMFIAALFAIAKTKKQFKCPLTYTCIGLP